VRVVIGACGGRRIGRLREMVASMLVLELIVCGLQTPSRHEVATSSCVPWPNEPCESLENATKNATTFLRENMFTFDEP
jgi:hypothetical protein